MTALAENEFLTDVNDGLRIIQNREGLTYGTDAFLLSAFVRRSPHAVAAEIGSGSGIISLLLAARQKLKTIYAIEVQAYYADLTARNVTLNGLEEIVRTVPTDARSFRTECDMVFMNPPFMKTTSGYRNENDGKFAARHEVFGDITDLCSAASDMLKTGGDLYVVYRPDRLIDLLTAMRESRIEPKRLCFVHPTSAHKPCLALVAGKKGGKSGCDLLRPLFLTDENGKQTPDAERIYQTGDWIE